MDQSTSPREIVSGGTSAKPSADPSGQDNQHDLIVGWLSAMDPAAGRLTVFDGDKERDIDIDGQTVLPAGRIQLHSAVAVNTVSGADRPVALDVRVCGEAQPNATARLAERRVMDFRQPDIRARIKLRHDLWLGLSNHLAQQGFQHVETPILSVPSGSGAQEFLAQSQRTSRAYSLPQSPQIYGHLLAIGGVKRYFQWGRCFRDEDLRSNRQPEFTQLHIEMGFADRDTLMDVVQGCIKAAFAIAGRTCPEIGHISYDAAMSAYGTDKPDMRLAPTLRRLPIQFTDGQGSVFTAEVPEGVSIDDALYQKLAKAAAKRRFRLIGSCRAASASDITLPMTCDEATLCAQLETGQGGEGHTVLVFVGDWDRRNRISRAVYAALANADEVRPAGDHLTWLTGFPLFESDPDRKGRLLSACHPFLMPVAAEELMTRNKHSEFLALRGHALDLVMNGEELGSGSMLISDRVLQTRVFHILGLSKDELRANYGLLLEALQAGAPPIGGFGIGFDRLVASLIGCEHIRDVIPFPKSKTGMCIALGDGTVPQT